MTPLKAISSPDLQGAHLNAKTGVGGFGRRQALALLMPVLIGLPLAAQAQTELSDLAKVRASGVLKVAVYKDNAPFAEGPASDMRGLDVALAAALAKAMNLRLALLPFDADENMGDDLRNMVWKGHYLGYGPADVMLQVPVDKFLMDDNPQVLVVGPYMRQSFVLLRATDQLAQVQRPEDLKGKTIAAERGTGAASAMMGYGGGLLREHVQIYNTGMQAGEAVLKGQAAAAYLTRAQAEAALHRAGVQSARFEMAPLALHGIPNNGWPVGMAVKKTNRELGQALEAALKSLRDSGELLSLFQQQGMTLTAP
jgi:polar amino acid transport system substrate-binding protein